MNPTELAIRARKRRFAQGHAIADELDILVSSTLRLNRAKHMTTVEIRKLLMAIERQLKSGNNQR